MFEYTIKNLPKDSLLKNVKKGEAKFVLHIHNCQDPSSIHVFLNYILYILLCGYNYMVKEHLFSE